MPAKTILFVKPISHLSTLAFSDASVCYNIDYGQSTERTTGSGLLCLWLSFSKYPSTEHIQLA